MSARTFAGAIALVFALAGPALAQDRYSALFAEGIARLEARDYEGAIASFRGCIELRPDLPEAYYNMACAYSLEGEKARAIDWLAESIARGFRDKDHIDKDPDLDPIRKEPRFCDLMARSFPESGVPLPAAGDSRLFTLKGEPASLAPLAGKVVVYELWRTWSKPCREAAHALTELERAFGERGLEVVAISNEPAADQEKAADELKIGYTLLRSEGALSGPIFEGAREVFPSFFVVGRDGRVAKRLQGARTKEELEAIVKPLLESGPRVF
jgi:peroxiredoxin